ncbi:PREDICTED: BEL1-like homeodomain protein 1 [Nelumbo nucifera]|uniref:BEL1-like homeodomain protein 1 n=1 Tax=Nelumbo nucifera TaxID=4432 RepID=A0A1U8A6X3_NELNU|nr:PREDICTED: BEL1-like homeodomain protein 1 [Nelumbo nucifera]XP_010263013.1 PREDICTED: BEL1-like homeodomain protein 1 [Nelumbo nucifera]
MATYFHGTSEIQADGLQTLYLMNPGYVGYSDTQPPSNMVFLNSAGNTLNPASLSHAAQTSQHLVGIPLQATAVAAGAAAASQDPNRPSVHSQQDMSTIHGFVPRVHYNLWTPMDPTAGAGSPQAHHQHQISTTAAAAAAVSNSVGVTDVSSQLGLRRSVVSPTQQGLSLSLSSHQQTAYGSYRQESDIPAPAPAPAISPTSGNEMRISGGSSSSASAVSNGISGMQSVLLGSKYLKAAQQLLDEVVNVGKGIKTESAKGSKGLSKLSRDSNAGSGEVSNAGETSTKPAVEFTTAERQELQMRKAKLVSMLDEVEQRYRQYHHQMQIVVSAFEQAAGFGSAKTYTALALQTISKQFRCLKDAISGQIRATSKSLGEEDCFGGKSEGSRLRFVDQQLRQQRALQQIGMIQHNAWRPQRGLPERSVSVLRAWLFEHFLHPYPKDSDKHMLAKQTGLSRGQVSNWFINARVRLWKPMVEEMYLEETKDQEQNGSEDKTSRSEVNEDSGSKSNAAQENSPARTDQIKNFSSKQDNTTNLNAISTAISNSSTSAIMGGNIRTQAGFSLIGSSDVEGFMQGTSPKKLRSTELQQNSPSSIPSMDTDVKPADTNRDLFTKFDTGRQSRGGYPLITNTTNHGGAFSAYSLGELGRFDPEQFAPRFSGNGVSLTLGLPHCENLSLSGTQQTYLSNQNIQLGRRLEIGGGEPNDFCGMSSPPPHSSAAYENMNIQNGKRFAAQLLPDFVA